MMWETRYTEAGVEALYLHIPFCLHKCAYCDFVSTEVPHGDHGMACYVDVLKDQLAVVAASGLLASCKTAYIGGGTPTMLGEDLVRLVGALRASCPKLMELSCEANPESLTDDLLVRLRAAGVTRLSIGVQSTNDEELRALGRIHSAERASTCARHAHELGFDVSCDLMCAIPLQTPARFQQSLVDVIATGATHVSVYPLQIEDTTPLALRFADEDPAWNSTDIQADRLEQARRILEEAGFVRYEVASYARPGRECRHNLAYWSGVPYLGLGSSAASMLSPTAYERLRGLVPHLPELASDITRIRLCMSGQAQGAAILTPLAASAFDVEFLTREQMVAEDVMLGARMVNGVDAGLCAYASRVFGYEKTQAVFCALRDRGLIWYREGRWRPTHTGWLMGNELFGELWDLAPDHGTIHMEVQP